MHKTMEGLNHPLTKFALLVGVFLCYSPCVQAQAPSIEWQSCFGGASGDEGYEICQTADGGYILVGTTTSPTITSYHGGMDVFVVRLDALGNLLWQKAFGGTGQDFAYSIEADPVGGYIVGGRTNSTSGDVAGNHGDYDGWVFKITESGNLLWQKCIGGPGFDSFESFIPESGGVYIGIGSCSAGVSGNLNTHRGSLDYLLVKVDLSDPDSVSWIRSFGGSAQDMGFAVCSTSDGGYFVGGSARSTDHLVLGNHGSYDAWVFKTNANGVLSWRKSLGGIYFERANSVMQTLDGGYAVVGQTTTYPSNGDVVGGSGSWDNWVVKLSVAGSTATALWSTCVGGSLSDVNSSGFEASDGSYVLTGYSLSADGNLPGNYGNADFCVAKVSPTGVFMWAQNYGGPLSDFPESVKPTSDGGLVVVGRTSSLSGDVFGHNGAVDVWVVKLRDPLVLPVELVDFSGEALGKDNVLLRWLTASEQDVQSFSVFRSRDPSQGQWNHVGDVLAFGNTYSQSSYSLIDRNPLGGVNYYKLRTIDTDGSWSDSEVISVHVDTGDKGYLVLDVYGRIIKAFSEDEFIPNISGVYIFQYGDGTSVRKFCVTP